MDKHLNNWKFTEPKNTGVFVSSDVFEGDSPIVQVTHSIDGDWQFLGYGPWENIPKLICLEDVVQNDASVQEVADLPLLWSATREHPSQPWDTHPEYPLRWDLFVDNCIQYTQTVQQKLMATFPIGRCEQYQLDLEQGKIEWTNKGQVVVEAEAVTVGTYSTCSESWRWNWASEQDWSRLAFFSDFGQQNQFRKMSEAQWSAQEIDAHEMMSVACYLLQAQGVYNFPYEHCFVYYTLADVRWLNGELAFG